MMHNRRTRQGHAGRRIFEGLARGRISSGAAYSRFRRLGFTKDATRELVREATNTREVGK